MILSLKEFLREGHVDNIHLGISWPEIVGSWGNPDSASRMSRGKNSPFILKYGCIEFHLNKEKFCFLIFIDYESCRKQLLFPEGAVIEDWDVSCGSTKKEVVEVMNDCGLFLENVKGVNALRVQQSNVNFGFDNAGVITSIYLM